MVDISRRARDKKKGFDIPIEQATAETVSKDVFNREFGWLKRELAGVNKLMVGIVVVLAIGFITLLIQTFQMVVENWRFKASVDQELIKSFEKQNLMIGKVFNSMEEQNKILQNLNVPQRK